MKTYKELREMMAAGTGGFTSAADSKGPVAGFDLPFKVMIMRRWREAADRNKRKGKKNK